MGQVILGVEYFGEWVEHEGCWNYIGKSKEVVAIAVSTEVSYDELIDEIIRRCGFSCSRSDVVVKYILNRVPEHYKIPPIVLKSDEDVKLYMLDVLDNGWRSILSVSIVDKDLEVGSKEGENEEVGVENSGINFDYEGIDLFVGKSRVGSDLGGEEETIKEVGHGGQKETVDKEKTIHVTADVEIPINTDDSEGVGGEEENTTVLYGDPKVTIAGSSESSHVFTDGSDLHVGYLFDNKNEVVRKLKLIAVRGNFEFITKKSNSSVVTVACRDRKCKWRVYCKRYMESEKFIVRTYTREHTCGLGHISGKHRQASADVIGHIVKSQFVEGKSPSPKDIQRYVRTELGCEVSYWKCWKGKGHAQNFVRGTSEHGYAILEAYRYMLELTNQGSKTALEWDKNMRFKYFFVAYGAAIKGFQNMRKVLAVDGCFLTGKFGGTLLVATAQDCENHSYPIAWSVVDSENDKSWIWFFKQLLTIVPNSDELCIISDRHNSIKKGIATIYPLAHHGFCVRHLAENIKQKFKCVGLLQTYYLAAKAYRVDEFEEHFCQIRNNDDKLANYLEHEVGFDRWSRAYFPGRRFNVITINIAESINSKLLTEMKFPIVALFYAIQRTLSQWFHQRHAESSNFNTFLVPSAEKLLRERFKLSNALYVYPQNAQEFIVRGYGSDALVDVLNKTCSCKVFDIQRLPCPHALAALKQQRKLDYGSRIYWELCSCLYTTSHYMLAYSEMIYPVPPEEQWVVPPELLDIIIYPPLKKTERGRKRVKRIPSACEVPQRTNKCSICRQPGHKRSSCQNRGCADQELCM